MSTYRIKDTGCPDPEGYEYGFKIKLPERSWFGDYQVMMGVNSTWNLIAGKNNSSEQPLCKVMNIDAEIFRRYVNEYPDFRRFIILRSTVRRAYFNYRMKLSSYSEYLKMKVNDI